MKTLGLDIGTNSIGWGIVEETAQTINNCGVYIFPEGVKIEKGNESSKAAERTGYRLARRLKFRRKLRKYETLKVLINNGMCPLSIDELEKWRRNKIYPTSKDFIAWYRTDENNNWEPYFIRKKCVEQKCEKQEIGRALYHIAQRRGFLSNRKETTKQTDGAVNSGINELSKAKGEKTLGQYFYELKQSGERIRGKYTSRKEHYEEEFNKICEVQGIPDKLREDLYKAIFFQRKLKSQKFLVGKCTLEPNKPRCPISHPEFEEFRMLSFINSIRVYRNTEESDTYSLFSETEKIFPKDNKLTKEEIDSITPLFFRISKPNFQFKEITKKIKTKNDEWTFNYRDDTNVAGCPVSAGLKNIFGDNWKNTKIGQYDIFDIWHVLFDFDDDEKLHEFALNKLNLNSEDTEKFCKINIQQGYANLSLKAIRKILPFLRKGYIYSHAVFLANIPTMIGKNNYDNNSEEIEKAVEEITKSLKEKNNKITLANLCLEAIFKDKNHDFHSEEWNKVIVISQAEALFGKRKWEEKPIEIQKEIKNEVISKIDETLRIAVTKNPNDYKFIPLRTDDLINEYLVRKGFSIKKNAKLYHPSETDYIFGKPIDSEDGKTYLGSPRTPSVKNPVAMRALHQLRKLLNYLIKTDQIDSETRIHIELANEVNDKNWRKAIEDFNRDNERKNEEARKRIIELCRECGFEIIPTESDIKKYKLWKEQNETCPYTGKKICITDLFGPLPKFDFEHTIPRSYSYDDSLENLTLCDSEFNRNVKKQHIPSELADFKEINKRFQKFYEDKIDECLSTIERNRMHGGYIDPTVKDSKIVRRHKAELELNYYKGKIKRFIATDVSSGFKHSQLNDTRIITKFALNYLKSIFPHTFPVKGSMTDTFKRQWGLLERTENKDRSNYRHHVVDALTIACIDRSKFNLLSEAIRKSSDGVHLKFNKPWDSFDTDVLKAVQYIIPKHYVDDNSLRQTKKVLRTRNGKPKLDKNGNKIYITGNTARGSLHLATFYGKIQLPPQKGKKNDFTFVKRLSCKELTEKNATKIVDKKIQETFFRNIKEGIQSLKNIQQEGILLPEIIHNNRIYTKKIRVRDDTVKNPLQIKIHRDISNKTSKEYKQWYYAVNEENYLVALYRGKDTKGNPLADCKILSLFESILCKRTGKNLYLPEIRKNNVTIPIYTVLKMGKIVLLQKDMTEDLFSLPSEKIFKRAYRIAGLAKSGNYIYVMLSHILSSKPWEYVPGSFDLDDYVEFRRYQVNNFMGLVEGIDFTISPAGEIIKK